MQDSDIPRRPCAALSQVASELEFQLSYSTNGFEDREVDIAIAACAINYNAALWTLNVADFADIPGLQLYQPAAS